MLTEKTDYMTSGMYIGMKSCTPFMKQFVYKIREDGLAMFNLKKIDERLKTAADFLSRFDKVLVVSRKDSAEKALKAFAAITGAKAITGRFNPGTLTNPSYKDFYEPDVILVVDPVVDSQAVTEAKKKRIPIVALSNTFNSARDVDLVVPMNNNGKKALALAFWIMAREVMKNKKKASEFKATLEEFGDTDGS